MNISWLLAIAFPKEGQISKMFLCQSISNKSGVLRVGFIWVWISFLFVWNLGTGCLFVLGLFSWFGAFFVVSLGRQTYSEEEMQRAFRSVYMTLSKENTEKASSLYEKTEIKVVFASCHHSKVQISTSMSRA